MGDLEEWQEEKEPPALSAAGIAKQNSYLLRRYGDFRRAADAVAAAWQNRPEVAAVALIGSVAVAPWKEVPRFSPYRRKRIELWHECKDLDLALWLTDLGSLNALRGAKDLALRRMLEGDDIGVASHQADVFIFEPGTDRYLGRLCLFNRCPKEKAPCLVPGCGTTKFLQQHQDFTWQRDALAEDRIFDRSSGLIARAVDLPLPEGGGDVQHYKQPATRPARIISP